MALYWSAYCRWRRRSSPPCAAAKGHRPGSGSWPGWELYWWPVSRCTTAAAVSTAPTWRCCAPCCWRRSATRKADGWRKAWRRAGDLLGADFIAAGAAAGDGLAVVARRAAHRPCRRARLDGIRLRFRVLDVHRLLLLVSRHGAGRRGAGRTGTTGAAVFKLAGRRRAAQGSAVMVECAVRAGRHRGGGGGPADARQALGIQRRRAVATLTPRLIYNVPSTSPQIG